MALALSPIYTQTASGSTNFITFNNIPQNYSHLIVEISARSTYSGTTDYLTAWYNGDRSSIYTDTGLGASGTTASSPKDSATTAINIGAYPAANTTAGTYGNIRFVIPNYSSGALKNSYSDAFMENNSTTVYTNYLWSHSYASNKPITSLTLYAGSGNFTSYSTFTIYGLGQAYPSSSPSAPTITSVTDLAGTASVAFTPTLNDQSSNYSVTTYPATSTFYGSVSPITINGLTPNTPYVFQVSSNNPISSTNSAASQQLISSNSYASIATQSVTNTTTSSITFSNIPQNYNNLELRAYFGQNAVYDVYITYNGDTGLNYTMHQFYGDGTTAGTYWYGTGQASDQINFPYQGVASNSLYFAGAILNIPGYNNTNQTKSTKKFYGINRNGTGLIGFGSGNWNNLSPISSITITASGNFLQNTVFRLYGIS